MISEQTLQTIQQLYAHEAEYQPSRAVSDKLADKTLVMTIGATCVGKGTVMELVAQQSDIQVVGVITTRPSRPDDTARYTYYDYTDEGLAPLLARIQHGELVQYAVHPFNNHIYATDVDDYPGSVCIGDFFSTGIEPYKSYGFKRLLPVTITTDPASWRRRFEERFPAGHQDRLARLQEAEQSLHWSLAQQGTDHHWAINRDDEQAQAVADILGTVAGTPAPSDTARNLASKCLELVQKLKSEV